MFKRSQQMLQYFLTLSWDTLAILQFFIPLFNERLWLGHYYSYAQAAPWTNFILLIMGLCIHRFSSQGLKTSFVYKITIWVWNEWKHWLEKAPWKPLTLAYLANGSLWAFSSLKRHWNLGSASYDLGLFTQTLWSLSHGYGYHSSIKQGADLFSDHVSPLFWIFAPIYRIFPYPETLLILQAFGLTAGGVAVFFLVKSYFKDDPKIKWESAIAPWLYWLYLPIRNANSFDFHPEVFMLPLFLWGIVGIYSLRKFHRILGIVALILSMGAKETAPLVAVGMGVAWILGAAPIHARSFSRKCGIVLFFLGSFVFWFDVQIVPTFFNKTYTYQYLYSNFGNGPMDWVLNILKDPKILLPFLWNPARKEFLMQTLKPLGFLPLLNIIALPAVLPGYFIYFLTPKIKEQFYLSIIYQYATESSVGLFFSLGGAFVILKLLIKSFKNLWKGFESVPKLWVLFFCLSYLGQTEFVRTREIKSSMHAHWIRQEVLPCIDPDISIASPAGLMPHLANRPWSTHLPDLELPGGGLVSCAIFDRQLIQWLLSAHETEKLKDKLFPEGYHVQYNCGSLSIYGKDISCLICQPKCEINPH